MMPPHPEYLDNARQAYALGVCEPREFMSVVFDAVIASVMDADELVGDFYRAMSPPPPPGSYSASREVVRELRDACRPRFATSEHNFEGFILPGRSGWVL